MSSETLKYLRKYSLDTVTTSAPTLSLIHRLSPVIKQESNQNSQQGATDHGYRDLFQGIIKSLRQLADEIAG